MFACVHTVFFISALLKALSPGCFEPDPLLRCWLQAGIALHCIACTLSAVSTIATVLCAIACPPFRVY